jgi:hypothetical protein
VDAILASQPDRGVVIPGMPQACSTRERTFTRTDLDLHFRVRPLQLLLTAVGLWRPTDGPGDRRRPSSMPAVPAMPGRTHCCAHDNRQLGRRRPHDRAALSRAPGPGARAAPGVQRLSRWLTIWLRQAVRCSPADTDVTRRRGGFGMHHRGSALRQLSCHTRCRGLIMWRMAPPCGNANRTGLLGQDRHGTCLDLQLSR